MLECPSCQQVLPFNARFCTRCGLRLSTTLPTPTSVEPYAHEKRLLADHCMSIMSGMESLLPFVYEDRRAENQALFASTLAQPRPLEDPVWGRVAFVLGAYGNYMHRYPLTLPQKQQVWQALLWAVYYERCFRRKYLTQRFQQLLHFVHGCVEDPIFLSGALDDLEALRPYLEISSLKKAVESLARLPEPPTELLHRLNAQLNAALGLGSSLTLRNNQFAETALEQFTQTGANQHFKHEVGHTILSHALYEESNFIGNAADNASMHDDTVKHGAISDICIEEGVNLTSGVARILLLFLSEEQCREFLISLRAARLETLGLLLRGARRELLTVLRHAVEMDVSVCQEPRRPIRLGRKHADRFDEARHLLASQRADEQQRGLRLFEQGARETTHPDYTSLAREWLLYARALVQGSPRVIDDWEQVRQSNEASWEELWNLAAFYQQTRYPAESLSVLRPEIEAWRAPMAHVRLALTAALDEESRMPEHEGTRMQTARTFLLAHLEHWPHPLCPLAWLVLAEETHGPLHPRQQSQRLSAFQALAEQALPLPDPRLELSATQVLELEEILAHKARYVEAWFFWINDYAERHLRMYAAWTKLADVCEHLGRLERAAEVLQHLVEIQYHHDYAHYQEGTPLPRARFLRRNLEKLFEYYQRHRLFEQGSEAFTSCYPVLSHLWDVRDPENRKLLTLTQPYLEARQRAEERVALSRRELNVREISLARTMPLELGNFGQQVGIFVDYENIARFVPREADIEEVGRILLTHAASFGEVVCRWASASPQNLSNLADVRGGLEAAGFRVRLPRRELQFSPSKKNLADFALLECLSEAAANERPNIYLIVSGDRDYYERICSLLDAGHTVRLLASTDSQHLSLRYRELEQQRARLRQEAGHTALDFFIDDLETLLCPLATGG
ncbi:MAG: NYN domain-containing protein [Ktedonobacteraceae bacterium]